MRYGIRNSLILFGILILLFTGGWAYFHFLINPKLEIAQRAKKTRVKELHQANATLDQYDFLLKQYDVMQTKIRKFPKHLFPTDAQSVVYGFINKLSTGKAFLDYNLKYIDTEHYSNYGVIRTSLTGTGYFTSLYRFISALEQSTPLTQIRALHLESLSTPDDLGKVDIRTEIACYFYHTKTAPTDTVAWVRDNAAGIYIKPDESSQLFSLAKRGTPVKTREKGHDWTLISSLAGTGWVQNKTLTLNASEVPLTDAGRDVTISYNPFYPHIHAVRSNTKNLVNVERSKLIGMTSNSVYILDHTGQMQTLSRGDEVYLGYLHDIDPKRQIARFRLNKGGIRDDVVLRLEQSAD